MIARLRGRVESIDGRVVMLDVNGIGYEIVCSYGCIGRLTIGEETSILIFTDFKFQQDTVRLYGFENATEKQVFLLLIKVNGVGARSASDIISKIDTKELLRAIGAGDMHRLQTIKGVGKKTAERIVVELKDKVAEFALERQGTQLKIETEVVEPFSDAIAALQALGFPLKEAERAVRLAEENGAKASADSGAIVKEALRYV